MKNIYIGDVAIPLNLYATSGTAIFGIKGAGKTYTTKGIAEQLLDHGIPIVVFDAIGVWRYLKVPDKGKGYKVVVAGGKEPDLPLTPESAPEIVRASMRENIPLIIDLYDKHLSKADWRRIVQSCFRTMLYENEGIRHIILEEAPEYVPQKVMDGQTYAEVEKLVRMGGNASLGITLVSQRAQEVNKAVTDLCENVILMRQRGANAIDNLQKWVDKLDPKLAKEIGEKMPFMTAGQAWVFRGDEEGAVWTKSKTINSFHPDRKNPQPPKSGAIPTDTGDFVSRLGSLLKDLKIENEANDPKALRKRIADLEHQLSNNAGYTPKEYAEDLGKARQEGYERGLHEGKNKRRELTRHKFTALRTKIIRDVEETFDEFISAPESTIEVNGKPMTAPEINRKIEWNHRLIPDERMPPRKVERSLPVDRKRQRAEDERSNLPPGEQAILLAAIQFSSQGGVHRDQLTTLTGYKKSARNSYVSRLIGKDLLALNGNGRYLPTSKGRAALPNDKPLPTGRELRKIWLDRLPPGEATILMELIKAHPESIDRESLNKTGYKKSARNSYLSRLSAKNLITATGPSKVKASDNLF